jgi:hypothetical protein
MLITRDAHEALAVLKKLVDRAEEKIDWPNGKPSLSLSAIEKATTH